MICISSIKSDVYNKKKIQMFVVNMTFISSREVKKCIFYLCLWHSWNIHFFTSLDEIKVIFTPNIWISSRYGDLRHLVPSCIASNRKLKSHITLQRTRLCLYSPGQQHSFVEIDHEIFSTVILSLLLIEEGQLSDFGERICTILVNCLKD